MRITPHRGVILSHVISADEGVMTVDRQDLTMIASHSSDTEEPPAGCPQRVFHHVDAGIKFKEAARYHQIGETVVYDIYVDTACRRRFECVFESLTHGIEIGRAHVCTP